MSVRGSATDVALAGGETPRCLLVALGDVDLGDVVADRLVRFSHRRHARDELLIAPYGDDLWRRQPWPAADDLYTIDEPEEGARTLIVGADEPHRAALAEAARGRGATVATASRLRREHIERAGTVVLLEEPGCFPAQAFAVLAAARLLVLVEPDVSFGLQDGIDCLFAPPNDLQVLADVIDHVTTYDRDFAPTRRLGRLAADRHRASEVYARLAVDLELGLDGVS